MTVGRTVYHFSEEGGIGQFLPRPSPSDTCADRPPMVWGIDARLQPNYLLPRDCPRVTFYAGPQTTPADVERFLGLSTARHVVAVESRWLERIRSTTLYRYHLPCDAFGPSDACSGYCITYEPVTPLAVDEIPDLLAEIVSGDVELRVLPNLWPLHRAVAESTLQFSSIRLRNATSLGTEAKTS